MKELRQFAGGKTLGNGLFAALLAYCLVRSVVAAQTKSLWFDEILTLSVSRLEGWSARLEALRNATDGLPPLFYTIEHYSLKLTTNTELGLRLPSILGLLVTLICIFVFVKRMEGELLAVCCASSILTTRLVQQFNVDARPYSMEVACIAFAMVCYQRAQVTPWAAGLGLSLALAEALHHYAIFAAVPFFLAELVFAWRNRRIRWPVWGGLLCVFLPLLFSWPLLAIMKATYGAHYWVRYDISFLPKAYGAFLVTAETLGVVAALLLVAVVVWADFLTRSVTEAQRTEQLVEGTLLVAMILLPAIAYVGLKLAGGPLLFRYVLPAIVGMALAIGCVKRAPQGTGVILFALFGFLVLVREMVFWRAVHTLRVEQPAGDLEKILETSGHSDLPIVIADGIKFLPIEFYASAGLRQRLAYLVDTQQAVDYTGSDSIDRNLIPLRQYVPYEMPNFTDFKNGRQEFLVYVETGPSGLDWLSPYLKSSAHYELLGRYGDGELYLVKLKNQETR